MAAVSAPWNRFTSLGYNMLTIYRLIKDHPDSNFGPAAINSFVAAVCGHLQALQVLSIGERPKHHQLMEMGARLLFHGTPAWTGCWKDESDNCRLKELAQQAHSGVFHERVLSAWMQLQTITAKKRRQGV